MLLALAAFGLAAALAGAPAPTQAAGVLIAAFGALVGALLVIFTDELGTLFDDGVPRASGRVRGSAP